MANPPQREISIKITEARDYKKIGATGVVGGLTSNGHLMCHFFIESNEIQGESKYLLNEDGSIVQPQPDQIMPKTPTLIRELQIGILLAPQIVRSIGEWFITQSNMLEQIIESQKQDAE